MSNNVEETSSYFNFISYSCQSCPYYMFLCEKEAKPQLQTKYITSRMTYY